MIRVHVWDDVNWLPSFGEAIKDVATCTGGDQIPENTEVLIKGSPTQEDLDTLPNLQAIVVPFAGIPTGTRDLLLNREGIQLYNLHHNSADTAEMAISLYLSVAKQIVVRDRGLRIGDWSPSSSFGEAEYSSIRASGKRALILGFGAIGQRIGQVCEALRMEVRGVRRSGQFDKTIRPLSELDDLLPDAEALFVALPLTPETRGLLDERRLSLLPSNCIISNIGRGAIFSEEALYQVLASQKILGAGLDVWWNYPKNSEACFPSRFPFHELSNVVMTPHVGGASDASEEHRSKDLAELIVSIVNGKARPASIADGY